MVIVFLLAAIIFYAVLYLLYEYSQSQVHTVDGWLRIINKMIWMPDDLIFVMLRGLIIIVTFYVIADAIRAGAARSKRKRQEKRDREEELVLRPKVYDKSDPSY